MTLRSVFLAAVALLCSPAGYAQNTAVDATIEAVANALGMVRGGQRRMDSINTVQFSGQGTMSIPEADGQWVHFEITDATVGMSYFIPALRWDMTRIGPDGREQRNIYVVRGEEAWDETLPGIGATPAMDRVAPRLRQIWLTPHGVIRAAVDAENPGAVRVSTQTGKTTLTVDIDGTPVTATLDGENRPERVAMMIEHPVLGETLVEAIYTGYIDWPKLDVYFPSRIVHQLGGETTLDMTVTEFFQNPYVVFPRPQPDEGSSQ